VQSQRVLCFNLWISLLNRWTKFLYLIWGVCLADIFIKTFKKIVTIFFGPHAYSPTGMTK
jgi:hypothetical protein